MSAAPLALDLARWVTGSRPSDIPAAVRAEARRAFVNIVGCMLGGHAEPACVAAAAATMPLAGTGRALVLGGDACTDMVSACFLNTLASSIHTFDDTHLGTVVHPTGPAASALLAIAAERPVAGEEALHALVLGIEMSCRLATMITAPPARANLAWFTTGITPGIGAAATAARLLGLDEGKTCIALGLAAAMAGGFRETHGTMAGGLVPAQAGRTGLQAALLARAGFETAPTSLDGPKGYSRVFAEGADPDVVRAGLGTRFEMTDLAYKPYPCGVVIHGAIDAALDARALHGVAAEQVEAIRLRVHPVALQLCGRRDPASGMEAKASVYHWVAVALVRGRAGLAEARNEAVRDPAVRALAARIVAEADAALATDGAHMTLQRRDGSHLVIEVPHARGSAERPLTDAELSAKFSAQAEGVLRDPAAALDAAWRLESLPDVEAGLTTRLASSVHG
jgi:2-methylcitrate dehydratase PrpD